MGSSRRIQHGQKIHLSLLFAKGEKADDYRPAAHQPVDDYSFWEKLRSKAAINPNNRIHQWLELDLYDYTKTVLATAIKPDDVMLQELRQIALTSTYTSSCVHSSS